MAHLLTRNVASLQAAQQLEIQLRRLRFYSFIYLVDPAPGRQEPIDNSEHAFEQALKRAREAAATDEERDLLDKVEAGYQHYRTEMARLEASADIAGASSPTWAASTTRIPLNEAVDPCEDLVNLNRDAMARTAEESERVSDRLSLAMLLLGLGGPAGGLISGYGIARGLSRSFSRSEQLAAVGQLAAGVAHEVRNPLTRSSSWSRRACAGPGTTTLTREDLEVIHARSSALRGPCRASSTSPDRRGWCGHRATCARSSGRRWSWCGPGPGSSGSASKCRPRPSPLTADVDRGQICTVLVNLLLNALDAMPQGGRLEVGADTAGHEAVLCVADTGPGIPADVASRLFTPFVSTKPTGTGLGLSISRRILEEHGGSIRAGNRPEGGAMFSITLPLAA